MTSKFRDGLSYAMLKPQHQRGRFSVRGWLLSLGLGASMLILSACSTAPTSVNRSQEVAVAVPPAPVAVSAVAASPAPQAASTLGTQWGETRASQVTSIEARRINPDRPNDLRSMRYTDEASIRRALGANADRQLNVLLDGGKVEWSVVDEYGHALPIYSTRGGSDYQVAGRRGERYELLFTNRSERNYSVVATVDGLDVLSGQPGSMQAAAYVLKAGKTLRIAGFRKNSNEVAAFRFSGKDGAYASNTPAGDSRNIGVIGAALFELELAGQPNVPQQREPQSPRGAPDAFPADKGQFAPPPQYR